MAEIINKVANSVLEIFDLEDYYPKESRSQIDMAQWLEGGFLLKEKDFRAKLEKHNWEQYKNQLVAVHCSTEAIVPAWASLLIAIYLAPFAKKCINGSLQELDVAIYETLLSKIDYSVYYNKPVILKGCSRKPVPKSAYITALSYLQPVASSIMYGEACAAVPLFKKKK